ncbi:MAG: MFS transporter [Thermoflexales bacterium]|nr:MFS transporter [Thermoflexales bacterium]
MTAFSLILLLIEFLDEFVGGVVGAAWPLIRTDLGLTYAQIGLLLSVPGMVSSIIEPFLGILGDVWKRRVLVLGGGIVFSLACLLTAASQDFILLLLAFMLYYPASGAFISLSQATLMDIAPDRRQHNMARWTFAGSLGVVSGPLILGVAVAAGLGWRGLIVACAGLTAATVALAWRFPFNSKPDTLTSKRETTLEGEAGDQRFGWETFKVGVAGAVQALRRGEVLRWLALLWFSDLMLDVLLSFLALYCVDVVGVSPAQATLAVAVWSGVGLAGDFLLIPLLERVPALVYLRLSVLIELLLFPAFLLVPHLGLKLVLLGLLGLFNSGWYSILQAELYSAMPGQSGTVMAVGNVAGLVGHLIPLGLGLVAQRWGLGVAMWLLLLGPLALLVGLPRRPSTSSG